MDLEKKYHDADGNDCNILELVKKEPEWAANIIQYYEKRVYELEHTLGLCEKCGDSFIPGKSIVMPRELTAENGAKSAFIGEFFESYTAPCDCDGDEKCIACNGTFKIKIWVPITWANLKTIYSRIVNFFDEKEKLRSQQQPNG